MNRRELILLTAISPRLIESGRLSTKINRNHLGLAALAFKSKHRKLTEAKKSGKSKKEGFFHKAGKFADKTWKHGGRIFNKISDASDKIEDAYNKHAGRLGKMWHEVTNPEHRWRLHRTIDDTKRFFTGKRKPFGRVIKDAVGDTYYDARKYLRDNSERIHEYAKEHPLHVLGGAGLAIGGAAAGLGMAAGGAAAGAGTLGAVALSQRAKNKRHQEELRHHREQAERYQRYHRGY